MRTTGMPVLILFSAALACLWSSHALAEPELTHTRLFENHDDVVYRIPALAVSNTGTLLAVCNARVGSPLDNCPYIRLLLRCSTDNGKTWGPLQVLQDREDWQAVAGAGMVDPTTGEIMFQYTWDPGTDEARQAHREANKDYDPDSSFTEWIDALRKTYEDMSEIYQKSKDRGAEIPLK